MDSYPQLAMRFRTKVFTLFLIVAILTAALIAAFMYGPMTRLSMDLMRTNVLSIAATADAMLDPELHEKIRTRSDQETPDHKRLEAALRRARDANRRRGLHVKYIYSMRPTRAALAPPEFVLDVSEDILDEIIYAGGPRSFTVNGKKSLRSSPMCAGLRPSPSS
jgi:hypothetical protein